MSDEAQALLDEFLQTLVRDTNTTYDYSWGVRRYLNYLRGIGITDVTLIRQTDLAAFILSCAREVTRGSMRNILSYTKRFHEFLRDTGRLDIPFEGLFAVSVFRETKIQQPLSTDELNRILEQIDLTKAKGKRNFAIILLGAELGLRASDIIHLKLNDVDWLRKELRIQQQKTGFPVNLPLTERVAAALQDYLLNGRRQSDSEYLFLSLRPPFEKIGDAIALGCMFRSYQKVAGIGCSAFDGKVSIHSDGVWESRWSKTAFHLQLFRRFWGAELGLRASDIIHLKLNDVDWLRKELRIQQQKTGFPVNLPLTERVAAALQDYLLNGRRQSDSEYLFLSLRPPFEKIGDAIALGCMFRSYQKVAGIGCSAFDGKVSIHSDGVWESRWSKTAFHLQLFRRFWGTGIWKL